MKVAKFGGSSLANADQVQKVLNIIRSDQNRRVIVVSAPGARHTGDEKVTDLLYQWYDHAIEGLPYQEYMHKVHERFDQIIRGLGISFDIDNVIQRIEHIINQPTKSRAYAASRGECICAQIVAQALGFTYIPAEDCIRFNVFGEHIREDDRIREIISDRDVVIPGFYGGVMNCPSQIRTFPRGGSDLTGAIVARALHADIYENWTDVSGLRACDPRIVSDPRVIQEAIYSELREMTYMGANVFQEEAMFPVWESNIPTNIRNTNKPEHPGTMIYSDLARNPDQVITGIAGRTGFVVITIDKMRMNNEIGFARKILTILEDMDISLEHMPSGIDTLSIIIDKNKIASATEVKKGVDKEKLVEGRLNTVVLQIQESVQPQTIKVSDNMSMIAVVGRSMASTPGIAAKIFSALATAGINIRMINQGSSELNIILGVDESDYEHAIRAIYASCM